MSQSKDSHRSFARLITLTLITATAVAGGCVSKPVPVPEPASPSASQVESIRLSYISAFPNARVGVVSSVLPDEPYALVTQIDTKDLKAGEIVSFIDSSESIVAHGEIIKVEADSLAIKFVAVTRTPRTGDVAVKF